MITTERQLRNILGLPPADNRRIIPVTPPTEARLEPDWDSSLAQMLTFQPDIVQQQILVRVAELQLLVARNQLLPQLNLSVLYQLNGLGQQLDNAEAVMTGATIKALDPVVAAQQRAAGLHRQSRLLQQLPHLAGRLHLPDAAGHAGRRWPTPGNAQYILLRQRAYLQQIVHQTTHSLARFFLEVDANYKQFKTASRLRAAAAQRLEAQRAYYEEGRITIDRFLDAVSQYAQAVAQEAQYKTTYNISIVALEEAKGTLLAYNNIAVAEGPHPRKAYIQARDIQDAHRKLPIPPDGPMYRQRVTGPGSIPTRSRPTRRPTCKPGDHPPLPAPVGPLGPPPTPLPPYRPAGEPPILSQTSGTALARQCPRPGGGQARQRGRDRPPLDGSTTPAGGTPAPMGGTPPPALPANFGRRLATRRNHHRASSRPGPGTPDRGRDQAPDRPTSYPILPAAIDLPPLPK